MSPEDGIWPRALFIGGLLVLLLGTAACASAPRPTATSWTNYLGEQQVDAQRHRPGSALEVLALVEATAARGGKVRAVGSGHASSDVARPRNNEAWVDVGRLDGIDLDWPYYRADGQPRYIRVGAGATIAKVNAGLDALEGGRRALFNMGNYDAQTIAGAMSTGTHGSGIVHGPIPDRVVAIELVTDERIPGEADRVQRLLRIEPAQGVTDRARFEAEHAAYAGRDEAIRIMDLEQDDHMFRAALMAFGAFGIITSVTIETRGAFWLRETAALETWDLDQPPNLVALAHAHPEFLQLTILPHPVIGRDGQGTHFYLQTVRAEEPDCDRRPPRRPPTSEDAVRIVGRKLGTGILERHQLESPEAMQERILARFRAQAESDAIRSRSHFLLVNSLAPEVTATSIDVHVPLDRATEAIGVVLRLAAENVTGPDAPLEETWRHTSPLGIRFVGPSRALLAPSYDGPKVSIEIPLLVDTDMPPTERGRHDAYRSRMLDTLEDALTAPDLGGRPHWGQRNRMTAAKAAAMYGQNWTDWVEMYERFNAHGTFDNAFTDRMCLSNRGAPHCSASRDGG